MELAMTEKTIMNLWKHLALVEDFSHLEGKMDSPPPIQQAYKRAPSFAAAALSYQIDN